MEPIKEVVFERTYDASPETVLAGLDHARLN